MESRQKVVFIDSIKISAFPQTNLIPTNYISEHFFVPDEGSHHYRDIIFTYSQETILWFEDDRDAQVERKRIV